MVELKNKIKNKNIMGLDVFYPNPPKISVRLWKKMGNKIGKETKMNLLPTFLTTTFPHYDHFSASSAKGEVTDWCPLLVL